MSQPRPIQPYNFRANLFWWDDPFQLGVWILTVSLKGNKFLYILDSKFVLKITARFHYSRTQPASYWLPLKACSRQKSIKGNLSRNDYIYVLSSQKGAPKVQQIYMSSLWKVTIAVPLYFMLDGMGHLLISCPWPDSYPESVFRRHLWRGHVPLSFLDIPYILYFKPSILSTSLLPWPTNINGESESVL
jgi:hypothetical protein